MILTIDVPAACWLTANGRYHWRAKAARTRELRHRGRLAAHRKQPITDPVDITAHIGYPTKRLADPSNAFPTIKALIDGLVDSGLLAGDDHNHLPRLAFERGPETGARGLYRVALQIERRA